MDPRKKDTQRRHVAKYRQVLGPGVFVVLCCLLASCSGEPGRPVPPPDQRAKLLTIPDEYKTRTSPLAASEANWNQGRRRYQEHCALCHGGDGKGHTTLGQSLYPRAADLTLPATQKYSDGQLYWIISEGIRYSGMPIGRGLHTEPQIWQMVLYLRALASSRPPAPASGP